MPNVLHFLSSGQKRLVFARSASATKKNRHKFAMFVKASF